MKNKENLIQLKQVLSAIDPNKKVFPKTQEKFAKEEKDQNDKK